MNDDNLQIIKNQLSKLTSNFQNYEYYLPSIWLDNKEKENSLIKMNPIDYFLMKISEIYDIFNINKHDDFKVDQSGIYNFIPRLWTSFDHNNDGKISIECNANSFRETGTFLKAIALLPNLHKLGINTLYMLPIFEIGKTNHKGNLGSVYAIKNFYKFDINLSEPALQMPIEQQFSAFVEAAHLLGMKVIMEFIFRTASLDCDLITEHPDWFYWVYSKKVENVLIPPKFSKHEYNKINEHIDNNQFSDLPTPSKKYIEQFSQIPKSISFDNGEYIGVDNENEKVKVPNGFADWPPNDSQPIWNDVTYFKLYNHSDFNYIAYNTVRMYSSELACEENKVGDLWKYLENIIPSYITNYKIDGAMIDMGHSLPAQLLSNIIKKARDEKNDFIFFEENFELNIISKEKGFDAVIGPLFLIENDFTKIKQFLKVIETKKLPIPFFSTSENHNTPRTYSFYRDENFSKMIFVLNSLLPGILFIHSGFELFEDKPINTGLNFTKEEIKEINPADLALFSISSLNWMKTNTLYNIIAKTIDFRKEWFQNSIIKNSSNFIISESWHFLELELFSKIKQEKIYFITKIDDTKANPIEINLKLEDIILSNNIRIENNMLKFEKFGFLLFTMSQ